MTAPISTPPKDNGSAVRVASFPSASRRTDTGVPAATRLARGAVASLGIVHCGTTARYQCVGTDEDHRRRGLASHLLGIAARWAASHGCGRWVIITEETNPAGRAYRKVGSSRTEATRAYRQPPR